ARQDVTCDGPQAARAGRGRGGAGGDPVNPGREPGVAAEMRQAAVDGDEDLLAGVLALLGRNAERGQEAVNDGRVTVVEGAPGAPVAVPATHQDVVIGPTTFPRGD